MPTAADTPGITYGYSATPAQPQQASASSQVAATAPAQSAAGTQTNPLQPVYQAAAPTIQATTSNYNVDPSTAVNDVTSAQALSNAQGNANLNNLLASEGISGNDAIAADSALSGQQSASEAGTLASLIQNAMGMGLGQSEFNAGASNTASAENLNSILGVNSANAGYANQAGTNLADLLEGNYGSDLNAFSGLINSGLGGAQSLNSNILGSNASNNAQYGQNENAQTAGNEQSAISLAMLLGGL